MRKSVQERFWEKVTRNGKECWTWTAALRGGYGVFFDGKKMRQAHQVSWEFTNGYIPDGLFVLHKCDNPPCVNPDHLFLGTQVDNIRDRDNKGRAPRGENHYTHVRGESVWTIREDACNFAKVSKADVRVIRYQFAHGKPVGELAERFGVVKRTISRIVTRQTWKHV